VYPSVAGTIGSSMVVDPAPGSKLLAIANVSWNAVFTSSREKEAGSPVPAVQLIVH